jgi:predicted lipid-binding transport protein (Tim44 family)
VLTFAALGLALRLVAAVLLGAGGLLAVGLGFAFLFAGGAVILALGAALLHLLFPLLLIVGLIWLIRRTYQPSVPALPAPDSHGHHAA